MILALAEQAEVGQYGDDEGYQINAVNRMPAVDDPGIYDRRQG